MIRDIAHVLAGVIVALSPLVHWTLPMVGAGSFMLYEVIEAWHVGDKPHYDILEFILGFFLAVTGLLIKEVLAW